MSLFRIVSHKPQCCNIEVQSVSLISYTFILISNFSYSTTAFIRGRFSLQNHGKSIHLKSTWLSSSRLRKRMSSIIPFKETNRRGIFFLWQKNSAFCSSAYAMACSSLLVESFLLSKKDNWTFNELCCWRYSASCCCASGELASPYSIISLYCFISGICSGCTLLFSKGTPAYSFNRCCFVIFRGFSTE